MVSFPEMAAQEGFHHSAYSSQLNPEAKARYIAKLEGMKVVHCPYAIPDSMWITGNEVLNHMPDITAINVSSYLLNNHSYITERRQNALKSLQAKHQHVRPKTGSFRIWKLPSGNIFLNSRVLLCNMSSKDYFLNPVITRVFSDFHCR